MIPQIPLKLATRFVLTVISCALALSPIARQAEALTVISDLDDTIKITRVHTLTAILSGTIGRDVFIGMDDLTRAFQKESSRNRLLIVSGSPKILTIPVYRLLVENDIRADEIFLVGKSEKKLSVILNLVANTEDEFILIGDDQERDPEFYEKTQKAFPNKIKAVYIHQVRAQRLPQGQRGFYTAYEVALWEASEGRLGRHVPSEVQTQIERKLDLNPGDRSVSRRVSERLIPEWQKCFPKGTDPVLSAAAKVPGADMKYLKRVARIVTQNCEP